MELKIILEAILFSAQKPLSLKELRDVFAAAVEHAEGDETVRGLKKVKETELTAALEQLAQDHDAAKRSYRLACVAGSWQFVTEPEYAPWLKALVGHKPRPPRLSQPALETLAIIAYRQPITRAEIEQVRGVSVDGVMQTLVERGLVEQVGRAEVVGRPMTYGTTVVFLEYFGLRSLEELPAADELRRVVVEKPESLVTAEPGLATAPPEQLALPTGEAPSAGESPAAAEPAAEPPPSAPQPDAAPGADTPAPDTQP
jgi:segregation and condensation protein B